MHHFITHHPGAVFVLSFLGLWAATAIGAALKKRRPLDEELRQDFNMILAATLTLLGLLIGVGLGFLAREYSHTVRSEADLVGLADELVIVSVPKVRSPLKKVV